MRQVFVTLRSLSSYSQSRFHEEPKKERETADAWDDRTWRHKCTTDREGIVCIPAMALKMCLTPACQRLALQVPGRGKTTYTKFFESDVICLANVPLGIHRDEVEGERWYVNADGVRGSGKRVMRTFPVIHEWQAEAHFLITDDLITNAVFEKVLRYAGSSVGIGRFRPEKGGINGRFEPIGFRWQAAG